MVRGQIPTSNLTGSSQIEPQSQANLRLGFTLRGLSEWNKVADKRLCYALIDFAKASWVGLLELHIEIHEIIENDHFSKQCFFEKSLKSIGNSCTFLLQNHREFQTFLEGIQKTLVFKNVHFLKIGRSAISEIRRTAWERGHEKKILRSPLRVRCRIRVFFERISGRWSCHETRWRAGRCRRRRRHDAIVEKWCFSKTIDFRESRESKKCTF